MAGKAAAGTGTIRKKTVTRKGKEYTYWEARYYRGCGPRHRETDPAEHNRQDTEGGGPEAQGGHRLNRRRDVYSPQ